MPRTLPSTLSPLVTTRSRQRTHAAQIARARARRELSSAQPQLLLSLYIPSRAAHGHARTLHAPSSTSLSSLREILLASSSAAMAPHPLLRGGARRGRKYAHGMHPAQMEALRAMCGALIPSLPVDADGGEGGRRPGDKDLERFYLASAADSSIPDEVGRSVDRSNTPCARVLSCL